jgi:hypothetical protein
MMRKITRALRHAKPQARRLMKRSVKEARSLASHYASRDLLKGRTGMALGAAVALPLAYMAVRSRQR